ncbi:TMEM175 family protein [Croceibacterium sp. TMG7-5b_MA50]|uniref:TMEM175 family protein n=1 Tax=Croceibacterium sp. TMG7-5b_MA50 TaxID=3121290 RepID=UPI00322205ED
MDSKRLEAFTDGVIAIIITIMVLDLAPPRAGDLTALRDSAPMFSAYLISFVNVGLYWTNHHHLMHATESVDGRVLWLNLALLFWLSLVPFVIRWNNDTDFAAGPTAAYGVVLGMAALCYELTEPAIIAFNGPQSRVARAIGRDRKGLVTIGLYVVAVPVAFVSREAALAGYIAVIALWFVPDRRMVTGD